MEEKRAELAAAQAELDEDDEQEEPTEDETIVSTSALAATNKDSSEEWNEVVEPGTEDGANRAQSGDFESGDWIEETFVLKCGQPLGLEMRYCSITFPFFLDCVC